MATVTLNKLWIRPEEGELGKTNFTDETIDQGELVYADPTSGKLNVADSNTQVEAAVIGMAIGRNLAAGHPNSYHEKGAIRVSTTPAAVLVEAGRIFVLGPTGKMMDIDDLATSEWVTLIGWSTSVNDLEMSLMPTEKQYPI